MVKKGEEDVRRRELQEEETRKLEAEKKAEEEAKAKAAAQAKIDERTSMAGKAKYNDKYSQGGDPTETENQEKKSNMVLPIVGLVVVVGAVAVAMFKKKK